MKIIFYIKGVKLIKDIDLESFASKTYACDQTEFDLDSVLQDMKEKPLELNLSCRLQTVINNIRMFPTEAAFYLDWLPSTTNKKSSVKEIVETFQSNEWTMYDEFGYLKEENETA